MAFATAKIFLEAAHDGEIDRLKRSAAALAHMLGRGIQTIVETTQDQDGRRAVHFAVIGGRVNVLKYLIEEIKVNVDVKTNTGVTPLTWAAIEGNLAAVEYLLEVGADPEIRDNSKASPLHHVAMRGRSDIIPLLLSKGINVDVSNGKGTPLLAAVAAGKHDTAKVPLDYGANPNVVLMDTFTPLYSSIYTQSLQLAETLLKAGADPNGGPDRIKALNLAVENGRTQFIKLLVEAGADPNFTNIHGLKPIEVAAYKNIREGVEILFPVTSPIPSYAEWSVNGIMKHANSKEFDNKMIPQAKATFAEAKSKGTSAFHRKEYWLAVYWYTEALKRKPGDAAVLSNRSMCYVCVNEGNLALEDATLCVLKRPDWPKAYYRTGIALKLLNRLDDAANAFFDGLKLDPKNEELENAFREVSLDKLKAVNVPL